MDKPITLEELDFAAEHLAKHKVPGKIGVPVEVYLALWEQIGPIILAVLQKGLADGSLNPKLTKGLIILLAKKCDQLLIGNE